MIKYTLKECVEKRIPPEKIVPDDSKLWNKVSKLYNESTDKSMLINVYETAGGRFTEKAVEVDDLDEDFEFSPLSGSKNARRRMKYLKNADPYTYSRMTGWD